MRKYGALILSLILASLVITMIPVATPEQASKAEAGHNRSYYWYDWNWSSYERYHVKTWYNTNDSKSHAFDYGGHRWNLLPATTVCVPGYVCEPGYLKIRFFYDTDLDYTYGMCPCGRVFFVKTRHRWASATPLPESLRWVTVLARGPPNHKLTLAA